ncbi:MAG: ABC transporter permease subunit [Clostridiales bacterium]|nr:ABC transporter permease subunit [Clostridiales bacterium]
MMNQKNLKIQSPKNEYETYHMSTRKAGVIQNIKKDFKANRELYYISFIIIAYYLIFCYKPMLGAVIAFKDYVPMKGIWKSQWVGFKYFRDFFQSPYFVRLIRNTIWLSLNSLIFGFPAPIILALLINEIGNKFFKRSIQTITYLPHFISMVVICGIIKDFTSDTGVINYFISALGGKPVTMLSVPKLFMPVYVISGIWQEVGWGSIIYLAALTGIDPQLYEASYMDGANRWKQTIYITLPGIAPTIIILFILRMGSLLNVGFEKILLLYNPGIYETADVISTYVYRKGLLEFNWGFSTAVGLLNSVINFFFLIAANTISRKVNDTSLW